MAWIKVAGSCTEGPCPTFYVDPDTMAVRIQANRVTPHVGIPDLEGMVEMSGTDWANLLDQYLRGRDA